MKTKRNDPGLRTQTLQIQRWMWLLAATVILVSCATSSLQPPAPVSSSAAPPKSAPASTYSPPPSAISPPIVAPEMERSPEQLWSLLQQAEDSAYAVLIRHATAPGTGDPPNFQLEDCSTQRNLSQAGRQQAIRMGETFRSRNIPVTQVVSSQWCRCLETAELMNLGEVEPLPPLNSFFGDRSSGDEQSKQVQQFLLRYRGIAGVIVLVSHQVNITALSDVVTQSGEAVVIQIGEDAQLTILGQLPASQS